MTDQVRSSCTVAVQLLPPIVTVTVLPASAFTTFPPIVWPAATSAALITLSPATVLMMTVGIAVSTCRFAVLLTLFPTVFVAVALRV